MVGAPVSHPRRPESHGFSSSSDFPTVFSDIFFFWARGLENWCCLFWTPQTFFVNLNPNFSEKTEGWKIPKLPDVFAPTTPPTTKKRQQKLPPNPKIEKTKKRKWNPPLWPRFGCVCMGWKMCKKWDVFRQSDPTWGMFSAHVFSTWSARASWASSGGLRETVSRHRTFPQGGDETWCFWIDKNVVEPQMGGIS